MNTIARFTLIIAVITTVMALSGCQEGNTTQLNETIQNQQTEISQLKNEKDTSGILMQEVLKEFEKCKSENSQLKAEVKSLKKRLSETPAVRERVQKGIEELRRLQRESAEKMREAEEEK